MGPGKGCPLHVTFAGASLYESEADVWLGRMYDSLTHIWPHVAGKL